MSINQSAIILEHFKYVVEHTNGLFFVKDATGKYLAISKELSKFANIPTGEVIGKTDSELPWSALSVRFISDDQLILQNSMGFVSNYLFEVCKNNHKVIKTTKQPVFDINNNVIGIFAVVEIITSHIDLLFEFDSSIEYVSDQNHQLKLSNLEIKLFYFLIMHTSMRSPSIAKNALNLNIGNSTLAHLFKQLKFKIQMFNENDLCAVYALLGFNYVAKESLDYMMNQMSIIAPLVA